MYQMVATEQFLDRYAFVSDAPFGIIDVGYTNVTSYAYPGGMKLGVINPQ